jgi:hypothetical protein
MLPRLSAAALAGIIAGCSPDAGVPASPSATPLFAPPSGITAAEAIEAARAEVPKLRNALVIGHAFGPAADAQSGGMLEGVPADAFVWSITFVSSPDSSTGSFVFVDYVDGEVYEIVDFIE